MKNSKTVRININHTLVFFFLFVFSAVFCYAQNTEKLGRIAILSFNGGSQDERDGIAELFSFTPQMMNNFVVIPRTTITGAINREQNFQYTSGMTDADTMARLGRQFGADYIMSGSITSLGTSNLLLVSIVKIDVIQQVSGDYLIYNSLDDLHRDPNLIRKMAENLVSMMGKKDSEDTEKLAVVPVQFSNGANEQEGDALAQLLSIFLTQNGKYAVFPRTKTLEQVQAEYATQLSGQTRDSETVSPGQGVNPPYVLSIVSRKIGTGNMFNASVIDLEGGHQVAGYSEQYTSLSDGINAISFLSKELSGIKVSESERGGRNTSVAVDNFLKNSGIKLSAWAGLSFTDGGKSTSYEKEDTSFSESEAVTKSTTKSLWFGGAKIEMRFFRYFGIQTGLGVAQIGVKETPETTTIVTAMQLPVLLNANIYILNSAIGGMYISPYGGIGFNLVSSDDSYADLSMILGAEINVLWIKNLSASVGYQYNHQLGDSDFGNTSMITLGLGWYLPLRK